MGGGGVQRSGISGEEVDAPPYLIQAQHPKALNQHSELKSKTQSSAVELMNNVHASMAPTNVRHTDTM